MGGSIAGFRAKGGGSRLQGFGIFGARSGRNGAEGAVLGNFQENFTKLMYSKALNCIYFGIVHIFKLSHFRMLIVFTPKIVVNEKNTILI